MKKRSNRVLTWVAVLAILTAPAALAAPQGVADVYVDPGKVIWDIQVENDGVVLQILDPCGVVIREFYRPGDTPVFYNVDNEGKPLDDGMYNWELKTRPIVDPEIAEILYDSRKTGNEDVIIQLKRDGKLPVGLAQNGYLTIDKGLFVIDEGEEQANPKAPGNKDFVILDDLIVDGSACIGFDCVNGESFGFDTIRLKENNLRIKFDDTSVAASYPRTDWQLTANSSANGGASKFSIDDISGSRTPFTVEANAPSHSLYVDDGGRIGLGTSTPSTEIHAIDGDTPALRLQQDGSSGFAPQSWDVAGNETNFFIRDVSNGSTLPFRIRPGAPTSAIFIDVSGDVGLGTSSPDEQLHVVDTDEASVLVENTTGTTGTRSLFELKNAGATQFTINNTAAAVVWRMANNGDFTLSADGTGALEFELDSSGNLEVTGNFISNGTTLSVPDYVFEDDYELMGLDELEAFVATEKHLPNIPSAKEVQAGGLNMTEMQLKLLEKVEELTLYTIDQQKVIDAQQELLEAMQAKLDALTQGE